jgi:hypothetical protein
LHRLSACGAGNAVWTHLFCGMIIPHDFEWMEPWVPISKMREPHWGILLSEEGDEPVSADLVEEVRRELPEDHRLQSAELEVAAFSELDPSLFVFFTDLKDEPIVRIALTWRADAAPLIESFDCTARWRLQMKTEYIPPTREWNLLSKLFVPTSVLVLVLVIYWTFDPHHLHITDQEWQAIQEGLTPTEVEKVLGPPDKILPLHPKLPVSQTW